MPFWKKSEDPWDVDPAKKPPSGGEEAPQPGIADRMTEWMETKKTEKEQREAPPAPIPCPWCGREMKAGYLFGGRGGVYWSRECPGGIFGFSETVPVDTDGGFWGAYKRVWNCEECGKLVMDFRPQGDGVSEEYRQFEEELQRYARQAKEREETT